MGTFRAGGGWGGRGGGSWKGERDGDPAPNVPPTNKLTRKNAAWRSTIPQYHNIVVFRTQQQLNNVNDTIIAD